MARVAEKEVPFRDLPPDLPKSMPPSCPQGHVGGGRGSVGRAIIVFNQLNLVAQCVNENEHDQVQFLVRDAVLPAGAVVKHTV